MCVFFKQLFHDERFFFSQNTCSSMKGWIFIIYNYFSAFLLIFYNNCGRHWIFKWYYLAKVWDKYVKILADSFHQKRFMVELLEPFFYTVDTFIVCKCLFTCVLGQTGTITVTLCYSDTMLGADCTPIRCQSAGRSGCLALCQGPLAWVTVPCTMSWLNTLPWHWIWE